MHCWKNSSFTDSRNTCTRFFEDYKKNENKEVKVDEFLGAEIARKTVLESMVSACPAGCYDDFNTPSVNFSV